MTDKSDQQTKPTSRLVNPELLKEFDGPDRTGMYILGVITVFLAYCYVVYHCVSSIERDITFSTDDVLTATRSITNSIASFSYTIPVSLYAVRTSSSSIQSLSQIASSINNTLSEVSLSMVSSSGIPPRMVLNIKELTISDDMYTEFQLHDNAVLSKHLKSLLPPSSVSIVLIPTTAATASQWVLSHSCIYAYVSPSTLDIPSLSSSLSSVLWRLTQPMLLLPSQQTDTLLARPNNALRKLNARLDKELGYSGGVAAITSQQLPIATDIDVSMVLLNIQPESSSSTANVETSAPLAQWPQDILVKLHSFASVARPHAALRFQAYSAYEIPIIPSQNVTSSNNFIMSKFFLSELSTNFRPLWDQADPTSSNAPVYLLALNSFFTLSMPDDSYAEIIPRWGAIVAVSPYDRPAKAHALPVQQSAQALATLTAQLRTLLGFPPIVYDEAMVRHDEFFVTEWEMAVWTRVRAYRYAVAASDTLKAMHDMLDQSPHVPLPSAQGEKVRRAMALMHGAAGVEMPAPLHNILEKDELNNSYDRKVEALAEAYAIVTDVFSDPSMSPSLYFPPEHLYAVLAPMFAPMLVPLLAALIKMAKGAYVRMKHKQKVE